MLFSHIVQHLYIAHGVSLEKLYEVMSTAPEALFLWHALLVVGFVIGRYVAAGHASRSPLLTACLAAVFVKALLLVQYAGVFPDPYPVWSQVLGFATPVPAALFGGWLVVRRAVTPR